MHKTTLSYFTLLLVLIVVWAEGSNPVIHIDTLGDVKGTTTKSLKNGRVIYSFYGVPYANAPKDDLRFKHPEPSGPWAGVADHSVEYPACPQPETFTSPFTPRGEPGTLETAEDCLRLDIHSPNTNFTAKLPVFVFLHGGAFTIGKSSSLKPNYLLDHDMVLVIPQFRLGPLGFLSLDNEDIPGNLALFDQNLALQWVRKHVVNFGGDPDKITLGGHSTGAALAVFHIFSPLSAGLFHRVIAHGGTALANWALNEDPVGSSRLFAESVGCNSKDIAEITSCLQGKSYRELVNSYKGEDGNMLSPVIQNGVKTKFFDGNTFDLLTSGNYTPVSIMAGCNKHDGLTYLEDFYKRWLEPNHLYDNKEYLKNELVGKISSLYDVPDSSGVLADALTKKYFAENELGDFDSMFEGLVDLTGTPFVKGHVYRLIQFLSESKKTTSYLYTFNYYTKDHIVSHADIKNLKDGVIHGDELIYLFPQENISLTVEQKKMVEILVGYWAKFIMNGNPNTAGSPYWPAFTKEDENYLIIDKQITFGGSFKKELTAAKSDGMPSLPLSEEIQINN